MELIDISLSKWGIFKFIFRKFKSFHYRKFLAQFEGEKSTRTKKLIYSLMLVTWAFKNGQSTVTKYEKCGQELLKPAFLF